MASPVNQHYASCIGTSGAARGERGKLPPTLWVDVQKLCDRAMNVRKDR